jgi:Rad3-related DNA helicase
MFDQTGSMFEPCTAGEFQRKLERYDGESAREKIGNAVDETWPAPGYREHQRETIIDLIEQLYVDDKDVVLLSAPTGAGKSLLLYTATAVVDEVVGRKSFSTTPLNTLIDQIDSDEFLDDVITIKGRSNYQCVHEQDRGTPVDQAICQRQDNFDCRYKQMPHTSGGCSYYGRKMIAKERSKVVTNLSFLMANSMIPDIADAGFDPRELLVVDECQNISDFALMFVGFTISENRVPIDWDTLSLPSESSSMDDVIDWINNQLMARVTVKINDLESKRDSLTFTDKQQDQLDDLRRFNQKVSNFVEDVNNHHWTKNHTSFGGTPKIEFKPVFVGRFLDQYLWSQSHKVVCASATIPPNFVEEAGLDDRDVGRIDVESTFPPERRPVITSESVGKMSYRERDKTLPKMADQIGRIADVWEGHKGFVHCHSYQIAERIYDRLPYEVQLRTRLQDGDDREGSLNDWMDAHPSETGSYRDEGGQVFLSVAMDEGISLDDELAHWQVVAKAAYPHMQDERVSYRMDDDTMGGSEWNWYSSQAAVNLQQAVGRGMRSKDDWCATYILDDSAVTLIERNKHLFEDWFLDAVDCDFDEQVVSPSSDTGWSDPTESSRSGRTENDELDDIADEHFG